MKFLGAAAALRLVNSLQNMRLYREYQQAFRSATGMTLRLRMPVTDDMPAANEREDQNEFCKFLIQQNLDCEACCASRAAVKLRSGRQGAGGECFAHMRISALPIHVGEALLAYLWTGQVLTSGMREKGFEDVERRLIQSGAAKEIVERLKSLWEATPEVPPERYDSVVTLLRIFAGQLGEAAAAIMATGAPQEPDVIRKARQYVGKQLADRITLDQVARHCGLSPSYFSRLFHRETGCTLSDYINRRRIEQAGRMLLKADARISEIAFEVGYQSLSQFNRSFQRIMRRTPMEYRRQVLRPQVLHRTP